MTDAMAARSRNATARRTVEAAFQTGGSSRPTQARSAGTHGRPSSSSTLIHRSAR